MSILKKEHHRLIYLFGLLLLAAALPLSKYFMSVAQLVLIGNWICEGGYREKFRRFASNRAAIAACVIMLLHLAGLLWTTDFDYAFKDIRIKTPLLVLPFIMASSEPLNVKNIFSIILIHAAAVLAGTLYSTWLMLFTVIDDMRNVSVLISHIRFGMNVGLSVFALIWIILKPEFLRHPASKVLLSLLVIWFVVYLFITGSVTGIALIAFTSVLLLLRFVFTKTKLLIKLIVLTTALAVCSGLVIYIRSIIIEFHDVKPVKLSELDMVTPYGNPYDFNFTNTQTENGHYVWTYICWDELKDSWNKRSPVNFDSTDQKGQSIRYTIIRYMTSCDLRKDKDGVNSLSTDDIRSIEHGITSIRGTYKGNFRERIMNLLWEYDNFQMYADPSGQTLMQRVELWKTSIRMIAVHPWFGIGTGDIKNAFREQLVKDDSSLKESGLRSHNQYLSVTIAFGFTGLLVFLWAMLYPAILRKRLFTYLCFTFFSIILISMLTEDTLETQPGVTFFAYWNAILLLGWRQKEDEKKQIQPNETEKTLIGILFKKKSG